MTRQETKAIMPIIQAYAEGKVIQYSPNRGNTWYDVAEDVNHDINTDEYEYRIKPTPKYRPFANAEECWNEMLKHQPVGWLKHKVSKARYSIGSFDIENVYVGTAQTKYSYNKALDEFIFADGAPFGVKEESDD